MQYLVEYVVLISLFAWCYTRKYLKFSVNLYITKNFCQITIHLFYFLLNYHEKILLLKHQNIANITCYKSVQWMPCWNDRQSIATEYVCWINKNFLNTFSTVNIMKFPVDLTDFLIVLSGLLLIQYCYFIHIDPLGIFVNFTWLWYLLKY